MNEQEQKRAEFRKIIETASARRVAAMDAAYQYKLSKGAPRDIAYEKWGAMIDDMIWRDIERGERQEKRGLRPAKQPELINTPKKDGPDRARLPCDSRTSSRVDAWCRFEKPLYP
jgi:hypothetical protein